MDNAGAHRGSTSTIIKKENIKALPWPAQSPDLNPIEQVWLWMSTKIGSQHFNNIEEIEAYVYNLWDELPKELILLYFQNYENKLKWVIESGGEFCPNHI